MRILSDPTFSRIRHSRFRRFSVRTGRCRSSAPADFPFGAFAEDAPATSEERQAKAGTTSDRRKDRDDDENSDRTRTLMG